MLQFWTGIHMREQGHKLTIALVIAVRSAHTPAPICQLRGQVRQLTIRSVLNVTSSHNHIIREQQRSSNTAYQLVIPLSWHGVLEFGVWSVCPIPA
jgi:hypothetical protein